MVSSRREALSRTLDLLSELLGSDRRSEIDVALQATRVRLVVAASDLATRQTQAAIYVATSLLIRSGIRVEASLPETPRLVDLPGMVGPDFGAGLAAAVQRMFPAAVLRAPQAEAEIVLAFGGAPAPAASRGVLRVNCVGRVASIARRHDAPSAWRPDDALSAIAAAGLGAVEVHKDALSTVRGSNIEVLQPCEPTFETPFSVIGDVHLGDVDVVSAGAITQNLFLTLAAEQHLHGRFRVFDRDIAALSNVNRCPFVLLDKLNAPKVDMLEALLPSRIQVVPIAHHFDPATAPLIRPGATMVVGADDIGVRHAAQAMKPSWLGIGATSHFFVLVTEHADGQACAGCAHVNLGEDLGTIPTISIVSFWAGFLLALRLIAHGADLGVYSDNRQMTNFWPLRPGAIHEHALVVNAACPVQSNPDPEMWRASA